MTRNIFRMIEIIVYAISITFSAVENIIAKPQNIFSPSQIIARAS
jgi:hypothetical protein